MTTTTTPPKGKGKGGKFGFLKDKRVLYGLAAAGGLGLVVLLKKGNGDTSATDPNQSGAASSSPSTYDSSSMDSYDAISQLGQGLSDQLSGYTDQLTGILTQLGQVNGPSTGGTTTTTGGTTTTTPPPAKTGTPVAVKKTTTKAAPAAQYAYTTKFTTSSAARGSNWKSTLSTIAAHYNESLSTLMKLNPSIKNANKIGVNQKIRVK